MNMICTQITCFVVFILLPNDEEFEDMHMLGQIEGTHGVLPSVPDQ
jgi:hypothetical protein